MYKTVTILNGQTTSGEVDIGEFLITAIHMPGTFTGTSIKFTVAEASGGTFQSLYLDNGTEVDLTVAASRVVGIVGDNAAALAPCRFFKLVASSQGQDSPMKLLLKPYKR